MEEGARMSMQDIQRKAMKIALRLPKDTGEALAVLNVLRELTRWQEGRPYMWLDEADDEAAGVVRFPRRIA